MSDPAGLDDAERVRDACIEAALAGYEDAAMAGLCGEGALEMAISAIRRLDMAEVIGNSDAAAADSTHKP
ncbi:acetyltransferase [Salinisphaera sp. C84B14]|uniref:acetyltransferase n=1 Tax=Salinisphaera sp. C84B14 TaxID=1304155 RepID=UPI003341C35D